MEILIKFMERQVRFAENHKGDLAMVRAFGSIAIGACLLYQEQQVAAGEIDLARTAESLWESHYRIRFEELQRGAS